MAYSSHTFQRPRRARAIVVKDRAGTMLCDLALVDIYEEPVRVYKKGAPREVSGVLRFLPGSCPDLRTWLDKGARRSTGSVDDRLLEFVFGDGESAWVAVKSNLRQGTTVNFVWAKAPTEPPT